MDGCILKVGRIAVFAQNAFYKNPHASACRFAVHPVHGYCVLDSRHQFVVNHAKLWLAGALPF